MNDMVLSGLSDSRILGFSDSRGVEYSSLSDTFCNILAKPRLKQEDREERSESKRAGYSLVGSFEVGMRGLDIPDSLEKRTVGAGILCSFSQFCSFHQL